MLKNSWLGGEVITIEDLKDVIEKDVLHELFVYSNDETISNVSKEDAKNLKVIYAKQKQSRQVLSASLETLKIKLRKM